MGRFFANGRIERNSAVYPFTLTQLRQQRFGRCPQIQRPAPFPGSFGYLCRQKREQRSHLRANRLLVHSIPALIPARGEGDGRFPIGYPITMQSESKPAGNQITWKANSDPFPSLPVYAPLAGQFHAQVYG
jgi:hypothetical protein